MIDNFVVLDSIYGKFIVARTCSFQAESLVKTGRTHIESELANIFAIMDVLPDGCIVIDGGANIGFFTVPVAQRIKAKGGRVISFEPQRPLFNALSGSLALNGLTNAFLHNSGLGEQKAIARLPDIDYSVEQDFGTVTITETLGTSENEYMRYNEINVVTIDSMYLPRLDFFKLDVEGFEVPALRGAIRTIQRYRPWIWVEYFITGAEKIQEALADVPEYDFFIMDYQNMLCVPKEYSSIINVAPIDQK